MAVIRTPLGRARGLGPARHGVGHFIAQRVTALALVGLAIWAAFAAIALSAGDYESAAGFLRAPVNAALASLLALAAFWHMQIGMRVIIEDYFARPATKGALLVANVFVTWAGGVVTVLAILKVAFSPAAGVSI